MTQANAPSNQPSASSRSHRASNHAAPCVAALVTTAGRVSLLVLHERRVLLAESTGQDGLAALLRKAIERGVTHLVSLIPADRVVCKPVATPVGSAEEINEAMSLLAEAELPVRIPACRRAWGRIPTPMSNGDGMVRGVLAGWLPDASNESSAIDAIDAALASIAAAEASSAHAGRHAKKNKPEALHRLWLAEPLALLGLFGPSGGSVTWASNAEPSRVASAAVGRDGVVCRASRGKPGVTAAAITQENAEAAAAAVAITEPLTSASDDRLSAVTLDTSTLDYLQSRVAFGPGVPGGQITPAWLAEFSVLLGAALFAADRLGTAGGAPTDPLLGMRPAPPIQRQSLIDHFANAFAQPKFAASTITAGIVLLLAVPYFAASIERVAYERRAATLEQRLNEATGGSIDSASADAQTNPVRMALASWRESDDVQSQLALYRTVRQLRWPMTKILADATAALPVGADLESVQLSVGENIALHGYADDQEIVNTFVQTLNNSAVFTGGVLTRSQRRAGSTTGRAVEFQVSVQVSRPYADARGLPNNYAETPLAVLLYGERARETATTTSPTEGTRIGSSTARPSSRPSASRPSSPSSSGGATGSAQSGESATAEGSDRPSRRTMFERPGEQQAAADPIPEPLTSEQIAALSDEALRAEFGTRRRASARRDLSEADTARLTEEVNMIRTELQKRRG